MFPLRIIILLFSYSVVVIILFYFGLYQPSGTIGSFVNGLLKLKWPVEEMHKLLNNIMLILMILLVNPVMDLIEKMLGKVRNVKI